MLNAVLKADVDASKNDRLANTISQRRLAAPGAGGRSLQLKAFERAPPARMSSSEATAPEAFCCIFAPILVNDDLGRPP